MRINIFSRTLNNESILQKYIDFYRGKISDIIINLYDEGSTDRTVEIAKENKCNIRKLKEYYSSIDNWKNQCWKYIPSDCVIICDVNEFIDLTPDVFFNCTLIKTKGYDIENINNLNEEKRNYDYDKFCIFDPQSIRTMNYEGETCNPQGFIRVGDKCPNLYKLCQ